ncbi:MAG: hydantoinase/oxoprolinase family protein, partial [Mesorhizobium sp.]
NFGSVAIGFIHAYANPDHERRAREILSRKLTIPISISAEVSPQMREFERFNTVSANAYVRPQMADYLARLQTRLKDMGAECPVFMIHSGGGLISVETASEFPVRLVESGPAGGAIFAADIARRFGLEKVVSYDMGGTTAKICLIEDFAPRTARTFEVARTYRFSKGSGMPISIPVIEMIEIGAGGGSIAWVDTMGRIQTGPESAGSEPGPACYG